MPNDKKCEMNAGFVLDLHVPFGQKMKGMSVTIVPS